MIINGNVVGNLAPRTDWNQKDPSKSDYLKGREILDERIGDVETAADNAQTAADNAHTAADNAQTAADNAQTAADNAQTAADNAQTAADNALKESKAYVDSKLERFTVVLTVNDWEGDKAPYTQTIGIEGILATDRPHYGAVYSEDTTTMQEEKEAFSYVDDLDTADGSVTFTCLDYKPEVNVTVQMEVHR